MGRISCHQSTAEHLKHEVFEGDLPEMIHNSQDVTKNTFLGISWVTNYPKNWENKNKITM